MEILTKYSNGLEISDNSLELVKMEKRGGKPIISHKSRLEIESQIIENGRIKNTEKLKEVFIKLLYQGDMTIKRHEDLYIGLPEAQAYIYIFSLPNPTASPR